MFGNVLNSRSHLVILNVVLWNPCSVEIICEFHALVKISSFSWRASCIKILLQHWTYATKQTCLSCYYIFTLIPSFFQNSSWCSFRTMKRRTLALQDFQILILVLSVTYLETKALNCVTNDVVAAAFLGVHSGKMNASLASYFPCLAKFPPGAILSFFFYSVLTPGHCSP